MVFWGEMKRNKNWDLFFSLIQERFISFQSDTVHDMAVPVVIIDRIMLHPAVIPDCEGSLGPLETTAEFCADLMFKIKSSSAFPSFSDSSKNPWV